jgi:hypothetical protein
MSGPSGWTESDKREWALEQVEASSNRLHDDGGGDSFGIDDGKRFRLLPSEDMADECGQPEWDMLELKPDGDPENDDDWWITDTFYDVADALEYADKQLGKK